MAAFNTQDDSFEITADTDRLMIEATADYGDSYTGWGSTCATLVLDRAQMIELRNWLNHVLEMQS